MDVKEYCFELEKILSDAKNNIKFQFNIAQINAWRLNADSFTRYYDETDVFNKTNSLMTIACILLKKELNNPNALDTLQLCAKIYEYLSESPDTQLDKKFLLLISAFCYDISGYQANAYCLTKDITDYVLRSDAFEIIDDNNVIKQMIYILQGRIPFALSELKKINTQSDMYLDLNNCLIDWYKKILFLEDSNYLDSIHNCYKNFLFSNNIYLSNLLLLLELKIKKSEERNIYNKLKESNVNLEYKWTKYIKNLSNNIYGNNKRNNKEDSHSLYEFWISQIKALDSGLLKEEDSFLVQMPTSAGKSFIAELFLLNYLIKYPEKHTIYISPFKALASEKENDFVDHFENIGFTVSTLPGNYEIDSFQETIINETDLLIATPEKIDLLLRINKEYFSNISSIIIDEGHLIGEFSIRGNLLEFLIIRLRMINPDVKILFLSAVMPEINSKDFSYWLSGKENNVLTTKYYNQEWQPTNKLICKFSKTQKGRIDFENLLYHNQLESTPYVINFFKEEVWDFIKDNCPKKKISACLAYELATNGNTLLFCGQVRVIYDVLEELLSLIQFVNNKHIKTPFEININKASYYYACNYFGEDNLITKAIKNGIGIHYSDLPEELKSSIEKDYKRGELKVLLCTSTLEQGVNLPIKNLIIHNLSYDYKKTDNGKPRPIYISNKDFWNLVGRAGRAGRETEGKIFFVINTPNDIKLYNNFIKNRNYETVESLVYRLLDLLIKENISEEDFEKIFSYISDTYLIDLLTQETIENEFETVIEKIIDFSLFNRQCINNKIDIEPIKQNLKKNFQKIADKVKIEQKEIYSTGLSFDTTDVIINYINENNVEFNDLDSFIDNFLLFLDNYNNITELKEVMIQKKLELQFSKLQEIVKLWIHGYSRDTIINRWVELDYQKEKYYVFETKILTYVIPWILTAYILVCCNINNTEYKNLEIEFKNLPSYLKYGVDKPKACILRSLGLYSRDLSLLLANNSLDEKDYISYIANLSEKEIKTLCKSEWDKENLHSVIKKLYPKKNISRKEIYNFSLKGTYYNEDMKKNSLFIKPGDILNITHDLNNPFDPYALLVTYEGKYIGYIPKEYNRFISTEIDLDNVVYNVIVMSVLQRKDYNEIIVSISER